jgi:predicted negative regulator of RcsB-dependent stress response
MNKTLIIILVIVGVLVVGYIIFRQMAKAKDAKAQQDSAAYYNQYQATVPGKPTAIEWINSFANLFSSGAAAYNQNRNGSSASGEQGASQ